MQQAVYWLVCAFDDNYQSLLVIACISYVRILCRALVKLAFHILYVEPACGSGNRSNHMRARVQETPKYYLNGVEKIIEDSYVKSSWNAMMKKIVGNDWLEEKQILYFSRHVIGSCFSGCVLGSINWLFTVEWLEREDSLWYIIQHVLL